MIRYKFIKMKGVGTGWGVQTCVKEKNKYAGQGFWWKKKHCPVIHEIKLGHCCFDKTVVAQTWEVLSWSSCGRQTAVVRMC